MNRIREISTSFVGKAAAEVSQRFHNPISRVWLGLFVVATLLQLFFNLPASLTPALSLLPHGTLVAITFLGFCCSTLGVKRGLAAAAVFVSVVAPLMQPLLAVPAILVFAGAVSYLSVARGLKRPVLVFLGSIPLASLLYVLLAVVLVPVFHAVALAAFANSAAIAALLAAGVATFLAIRKRQAALAEGGTPSPKWRTALRYSVLAALWLYLPFTIIANRTEWIVSLQLRHSMNPEALSELPTTIQDRMLPRTTAETYMQNLNDDYMTSVEPPHLQQRPSGGLWWQSTVHNNNRWGKIFGSSTRVVAVDADRTDSHSENTENSGFIFSDQSWVTKTVFPARHPFSEVAETCYFLNPDGSWSILLSYTSQRMSWSLPAPGTMIPYFAGVMEVTQNGVVRDWTVSQADEHFTGAVLYPIALFKQQADAYGRWRDGWTGSKILQRNVLEVSEDESEDSTINPQPYVQNFKAHGLQLTVSFEPKGDKQSALVEVLMCDASTGKLSSAIPPKGMIGPRQARLNVRSSDTRIDWSHIRRIEPRLVVAPRGVFFLVAIVDHKDKNPFSHPYITSVLVDAQTASECYTFQHAKEMNEFLAQPRPAAQ